MIESAELPPLGIIGGTGLDTYPELEVMDRITATTSYGNPSSELILARLSGQKVVFIPRHGERHQHPPHLVPYKANLAALKQQGVRTVVATCIVGSLKVGIPPGHFVVPDQFVHFTWGRDAQSVEPNGDFAHHGMAEPYCCALRQEFIEILGELNISFQNQGTTVVIQGPRFNTKAESRFQIKNDWDIVNMTQYPECLFARELGLCYAVMASVTDWDVGVESSLSMRPENMERVLAIFRRNTETTKRVLSVLAHRLTTFTCGCANKVVSEYYKR